MTLTPGPLPGTYLLDLEVVANETLSPQMARLRLGGAGLGQIGHQPGQDLMVLVPVADGGGVMRRRYSIRRLDTAAETVDLDIVVHGDGPGARWVTGAEPGEAVQAVGPRGKVLLRAGAAWHLFVGDLSAVPASFSLAEGVPAGVPAAAVLAVADPADRQPEPEVPGLTVTWTDPDGLPAATLAALEALGDDDGHVYVAGEYTLVNTVAAAVTGHGIPAERLSTKAYWRDGAANAEHGEPPKG
jgi:NADPH-dependent ferric siderophore reductase